MFTECSTALNVPIQDSQHQSFKFPPVDIQSLHRHFKVKTLYTKHPFCQILRSFPFYCIDYHCGLWSFGLSLFFHLHFVVSLNSLLFLRPGATFSNLVQRPINLRLGGFPFWFFGKLLVNSGWRDFCFLSPPPLCSSSSPSSAIPAPSPPSCTLTPPFLFLIGCSWRKIKIVPVEAVMNWSYFVTWWGYNILSSFGPTAPW